MHARERISVTLQRDVQARKRRPNLTKDVQARYGKGLSDTVTCRHAVQGDESVRDERETGALPIEN